MMILKENSSVCYSNMQLSAHLTDRTTRLYFSVAVNVVVILANSLLRKFSSTAS